MKKHKLGVCVPYRNREEHLNKFIPIVSKFLKERDIDFKIYFGHQVDDKLFNRGAMKNVAAKHAFEDGCDYIVWHDIDMVPEDDTCDYSYPSDVPQHIAVNISQSDYMLKYEQYFGGAVVFTTSGSAYYGQARGQHYGASKAGVISMMKAIAVEHARHGIRCNAILPGWIESEMTEAALGWDTFIAKVLPRVPLRRWGDPNDFSGIAAYFASDASKYHTGDVITIDGGYHSF
jgi:NAD(P)-dependent dehydrogenase (short-subunit alcohol dehydrogenase family)